MLLGKRLGCKSLPQHLLTKLIRMDSEVTGARCTLDLGISSWCMPPPSFELSECGLESVEAFCTESVSVLGSASASLELSGREGVCGQPREG